MEARFPKMDFSGVKPHWSRNHELAQFYNAASVVPALIEPYLVRVMVRAAPQISDPALRRDIGIFNKQEQEHCRQHNAFNARLKEQYPEMARFELALANDFKRFFQKKSLRFNVAYAEGFEAIGSSNAETLFAVLPILEKHADPNALALWKWHLAEEFEHRHVCFEVYRQLFGKGSFRGYFYRCYGYLYAYLHLTRHMDRIADYMIEQDRRSMTPEQIASSRKRVAKHKRMTRLRDFKQILTVLSPSYDPSRKLMNEAMREYLDSLAARPAPT